MMGPKRVHLEVFIMEDWKKMYAILCGGISEALDALPETPENAWARALLERALEEAEELYLSAGEP